MKLSGEQFQDIISQLVSDQAVDTHDKRREPRVGVRAEGNLTPWTLDDVNVRHTRITIRDLSPGGICILSSKPMQKGERWILQLPRAQQSILMAHYEVRYTKMLTSSLYSVGAKLVNLTEGAASAA